MASHLGCFVSFPVNRILRNKRHFRPPNRLKLFVELLSLFCFYCKANFALPTASPTLLLLLPLKTNESSCWVRNCRMPTVLPFIRNGLGKFLCFACELHVYGHFFGMSLPVSQHVCSCCFLAQIEKPQLKLHFYLAHKTEKKKFKGIVHCCCNCMCSTRHAPPTSQLLPQNGRGLK